MSTSPFNIVVAWSTAVVGNSSLSSFEEMKGVDLNKLAEDVKRKAYKVSL